MLFRIRIDRVQHVERLLLELNLAQNKVTCIVGKNGVGKTTLIRAIRNLSEADTFLRTASPDIFSAESHISYHVDGTDIRFDYDSNIRTLNCRTPIPEQIRRLCVAELPMPHGERFHSFPIISEADADIRRQIILEEYRRPEELIEFLTDIYSSDKFESLIETVVRHRSYYSILRGDNRYVREDYLSSGEYFLINLYRTIKGGARLIAIDEIDLSLDAAAQVHLLRKLRDFCERYRCNILFTTHSLAMMRMLTPSELLYMDRRETGIELVPASYSYIKTLLFGFSGWDRYILTEDAVLHDFIEAIIQRYCSNAFYRYKVIYVGGGPQVSDLLRRNEAEGFLLEAENVIAILDGDLKGQAFANHPRIHFLPIDSVEKALFQCYSENDFPYRYPGTRAFISPKELFNALQSSGVMSRAQIHSYLLNRNDQSLAQLAATLDSFLSRPQ
jgi:ABC-type dipeptide/oligopeptide/nickel transport system ATPase subunit